jgi:quercetin dioxygenase-like cupin family protein
LKAIDDADRARLMGKEVNFYADALKASEEFRADYATRLRVIKSEEMPWENSPDGLIKHIINERMDTAEHCVDAYMQFLKPNEASGKHRHLSEELVFVLEGEGYDLHWDVKFECLETFEWEWDEEPKRYDWKSGDFVYIPPYCAHQHFAKDSECRFICITSRIVKAMGFDWHDQLENAASYLAD